MKFWHGIVGWSNWRSGCELYEDTTTEVVMEACSRCEGSGKPAPGSYILQGEERIVPEKCTGCDGTGERVKDNWPRWLPRAAGIDGPPGRLLTDEMGDPEGARVLVIQLEGRLSDRESAEALVKRIEMAVLRDVDGGEG